MYNGRCAKPKSYKYYNKQKTQFPPTQASINTNNQLHRKKKNWKQKKLFSKQVCLAWQVCRAKNIKNNEFAPTTANLNPNNWLHSR